MAAYLIANIKVTDAKGFAAYSELVMPVLAKYRGRFIVRGGTTEDMEGDFGIARLILLQFPNLDAIHEFYESEDYAPLRRLRQASGDCDVCFVEGNDI